MKIKSVTNKIILSFTLLMLITTLSFAHKKEIAITIDDLPFVGEYRNFHLNMMLETLKEQQVPATGFIIAKEVRNDNWDILQKFRDAGFGLGNHTYSHANLNILDTKDYINEIRKADKILSPVMTEPKYFRYPYLAMSNGEKRNKILCYLAKKNYQVAPITVDSKDFVFNQRLLSVPELNRRSYLGEMQPLYLDFIWQQTLKAEAHTAYHHNPDQAQILLIHANLLNAYVLPDIIKLYKEKGYTFVTLEDALKTFKDSAHCPTTNAKNNVSVKPKLVAQNKPKVNSAPQADNNIESFVDWD
ncbi:polysaccharide deacetylase family protein [uncultured Legionella sp.]|uniref:polysaccharide deacetylase family protein n=1 Tax=uncultured Legionella sp. TaxID=210934 RepID=UPI0026201537|nr:polysaccharide deacetylase family protein [uncultured Legionella sp.]